MRKRRTLVRSSLTGRASDAFIVVLVRTLPSPAMTNLTGFLVPLSDIPSVAVKVLYRRPRSYSAYAVPEVLTI